MYKLNSCKDLILGHNVKLNPCEWAYILGKKHSIDD